MTKLTFEESLQLKEISEDVFENVHQIWTWPGSGTAPGPALMSLAAAAASRTAPDNFTLDSLHTDFLNAPNVKSPMRFHVTRLSNGRRFAVRSVMAKQGQTMLYQVNITFVNTSPWTGRAMEYAVSRETTHKLSSITRDMLFPKGDFGPFIKIQRTQPVFKSDSEAPETGICTFVSQITPIQAGPGSLSHILGVISLSDCWAISAPLQLNKITFGLPEIDDESQTLTENNVKVFTSLNHAVHFHVHGGFRADELIYTEVRTSWAKDGRAMLHSNLFSEDGVLIATCEQESFYVFKQDSASKSIAKL
ncbi:acyl-CoA thioesterase [Lithohypha guttulata]|nr:acyl-CoA thioesterase [Lithohypha guttulata]